MEQTTKNKKYIMKNKLNLKGLYGYSQSLSSRSLRPSDDRAMTKR